jgi:serine/threonine-protein kinase
VAVVSAYIDVPEGYVLGGDNPTAWTRTPFVFTPDGRSLIMEVARDGKPQLFLRLLDSNAASPIAGTEGARVPFVSPDGRWVGFYASNELRKVPIGGGEPVTICALRNGSAPDGASWSQGDIILFADEYLRQIMRVSARGGTPVAVTDPPPFMRQYVAPSFLPDGSRFFYSDVSWVDLSDARVMIQTLGGGPPQRVIADATDGRLLPDGQLAFMRRGSLMMVGFDPVGNAAVGEAVIVMREVIQRGLRGTMNSVPGPGMFAVSNLGALIAARGGLVGPDTNRLTWLDRNGILSAQEPAEGAPRGVRRQARLSPDGSQAIVQVIATDRRMYWLVDFRRNTWTACPDCSRGAPAVPLEWSTDGRRILVQTSGDSLTVHTIDGSAPDRVVVREPNRILRGAQWLADDSIVYLSDTDNNAIRPDLSRQEIKLLAPGEAVGRLIAIGAGPRISPDRRWFAYSEREGTQQEVIVQTFPSPGQRRPASSGGGAHPTWSSDGRTLYYVRFSQTDSTVFAVDVAPTPELVLGTPRAMFHTPQLGCAIPVRCYDIAPDGRFLVPVPGEPAHQSVTRMDLILNWTSTLAK